jgi:uncharacterized protein (UPF0548 family)
MAELLEAGVTQDLRQTGLTYSEVGATAGPLPPGYHHQHLSAPVGYGRAQFDAAAACLMRWDMHARAGLHPQVSDPVVQEGSVAVLRFQVGPVRLRVPVRVVRVVDEPARRGFVYGTLPGHPERGEESFLVEMAEDGTVFFHLVAFSRPGRWFTVLGRPVSRAGQVLISERYLTAVREAALAAGDSEVA